ncbi:MAG: Flp pilus assembly complex ATPase component TadA, partial [Planctomycetales bacterium]|nr:Flp pilus assembly complex ATPase component TadA [Planctomycetales bacterium]
MKAERISSLPPELASINSTDTPTALNIILGHAIASQASDLFMQSQGTHYLVSLRQMGAIRQLVVVSHEKGTQLVNLIKSLAGMDLAERRHPLDGRWTHEVDNRAFDFRINTMGTLHGEDLVL